MSKIRIISKEDIKSLFRLQDAMEAVEQSYLQKHKGGGQLWPMVFHEFEKGVADLDIKSGNLDSEGIYGLKVVSWYGENPDKGLPALHGTILLFDLTNGEPKALMNAGAITDLRTGAAAAIGAKYLARKDSKTLTMVGCGALAPYAIAATLYALPELETVYLINPHHPEKAEERLQSVTEKVDSLLLQCGKSRTEKLECSIDLKEAIENSDIILTATPAYEPVIHAAWVKEGTHISCIGADLPGKEELEATIFTKAHIFGDDKEQCFSVGECEIPYKQGLISDLHGEIGAVIAGDLAGRCSEQDITIFDSTGIALQDLASASVIFKAAVEQGKGQCSDL